MKYDANQGTLTLEPTDCRQCKYTPATQATRVDCPTCKGTGKGPRGGRGGCRQCSGFGSHFDQENRSTCLACKGDYVGHDMESFCDDAPREAIANLPLRVVRQDRDTSWNEMHLGLGSLWSCTDYGTAWDGTDAALWEKVAGELTGGERVQAIKIVEPYERGDMVAKLVPGLVILLSRNGYSIRPDTPESIERARREYGPDQALYVGMRVYGAGGNGTMAAALGQADR